MKSFTCVYLVSVLSIHCIAQIRCTIKLRSTETICIGVVMVHCVCMCTSANKSDDDEMGNVIFRCLTTVTTPHANKRFRKFMAFLYYRRCWRRLRAAKAPSVFVDTNLLTKSLSENSNILGFYSHRMIQSYRPPSVTLTLRVTSYDFSLSAMN